MKTYKGPKAVRELSKRLGKSLPVIVGFTDPESKMHYDYTAEYDENGNFAPGFEALLKKEGWRTGDAGRA